MIAREGAQGVSDNIVPCVFLLINQYNQLHNRVRGEMRGGL